MRRLWRRLRRLLAQSRIVLPRRALCPEDLRPGDRLEIGETVFRVRGALHLHSGPWAFRLEELDGTEPCPIRLLAVPESPGPWTLIRDGRWVEGAGGVCAVVAGGWRGTVSRSGIMDGPWRC
jgi:hypothetical protein